MGERFYGENFGVAPNKLDLLAQAFRKHRAIIVWDNFESAARNLTAADQSELSRLLQAIHGTLGKVIITSRSPEAWLATSFRFELQLRGLDGEERWEYCETILCELGLRSKIDWNDPELKNLIDQLGGHPLAMRVVLPRLERMPAAAIARALRTNIAELGLNEGEEQDRLFATLRFVEQRLPEELRPLLAIVGLHESYLDADHMEIMATRVDAAWNRSTVDRLMAALTGAGLTKELGQAIYELHPLLTSYLQSRGAAASESMERAFAEVMANVADGLATLQLGEQRRHFFLHGSSFRYAVTLADKHSLEVDSKALIQSLASYAQHSRDFVEASRLLEEQAKRAMPVADWDAEASAYHQLGMIAAEQRDFATARE